MKKWFFIILALIFIVSGGALCSEIFGLRGGKEVTVKIPEGAAARQIYELLREEDVIENEKLFALFARGDASQFKSGYHTFSEHMSYGAAIEELKDPVKWGSCKW